MADNKKDSKIKKILGEVLRYLVSSISAAIVFYILFALVFSTAEERLLEKENHMYADVFSAMKAKEELIGDVVESLRGKDGQIYEELFETAPPSMDVINGTKADYSDDGITPEKHYIGKASQKSDSLMVHASAIERNFNEIFRTLQEKSDSIPPLSLPIEDMSYVQTGPSVGKRHNPVIKIDIQHDGLDLIAPQGAKVHAAAAGRVVGVIRSKKGLGNIVEIDHGNGYVTRYALLGDVTAVKGRMVQLGQVIGTVGISTSVSAPHLHFEVLKDGKVVDPVNYFFASVSPEDYQRMLYLSTKTTQSMD